MKALLQIKTEDYSKEHRKRRRWHKVVTAMAAVVVFCTTYALILPAITWERSLICEIPEHQHVDSCYEMVNLPTEIELVCDQIEHTHGDGCFQQVLICQIPEQEGHIHSETCFDENGELICEIQESEGHTHVEECYSTELCCQIPEHKHEDTCFIEPEPIQEKVLICTQEEHVHSEACFDAPPAVDDGYYCGKIEHQHSKEHFCYYDDGNLKCTIEEHHHTLACLSDASADTETEAEWCATFEDVLLTKDWAKDVLAIARSQLGYTESTRNYQVLNNDVIKGYTRYGAWYRSAYGDWCAMFCSFCLHYAGVSEELLPLEAACDTWIEIVSQKPYELYHEAGLYEPKPGDLIFFDWDEFDPNDPLSVLARDADHVGFVTEITEVAPDTCVQIKTIEGNTDNQVKEKTYDIDDQHILGYVSLPERPVEEAEAVLGDTAIDETANDGNVVDVTVADGITEVNGTVANETETAEPLIQEDLVERTIKSEAAEDGAIASITGMMPENAVATIHALELTEEELTKYFGESKASLMIGYVAYDITIMVDDKEWQPNETVNVVIQHPDIEVEENASLAVAHVDGMTETISDVAAEISDEGDVVFEAEGFSTYIIYTVEFWYGDYMYVIDGGTEILLSDLFIELGIERDVSDVVSVEFSDPSLIGVEQIEADWDLITYQPFLTEETLTVTFADGGMLTIAVTDAYEPVIAGGTIVHPGTNDLWRNNDKLSVANQQYAYFYHSDTPLNPVTGGSNLIFANDAPNTDRTYDTIEFRNAFNAYGEKYNICVKIHLNSIPSGTPTIRWGNRTFLDNDDGAPYLSVGIFSVDGYTTEQLTALMPYDIDWEMWLEDPNTHELITWIPLMGGSCFVGHEYVSVYSTDNTVYTNFPLRSSRETFEYQSGKVANQTVTGWYNTVDNNDSPSYYALGIAGSDGIVKGRYITEWTGTGPNSFACELTANLYDVNNSLTVKKTVVGTNPNVPDDTEYSFRAGYIQNGSFRGFNGMAYSIYSPDSNTPISTGKLGSNGVFKLKDGQHITITGLPNYNTIRVDEYTSSSYDYAEYLENTIATVNGASMDIQNDNNQGTKYVQFTKGTNAISRVEFTNELKPADVKLTVSKAVKGLSTTKRFDFTATVADGEFISNSAYTITDDQILFSLADGEHFDIYVTKGAKVTVAEVDPDGFNVKIEEASTAYHQSGSSATFTMDKDRGILFTNTAGASMPNTGGIGNYPFYILGVLLIGGALIYLICDLRRKRREVHE